MKLKRWDLVCQDCRTALELDPTLIKAHFFLGQGLLECESYDESIKHLQRGKFNIRTISRLIFITFQNLKLQYYLYNNIFTFNWFFMLLWGENKSPISLSVKKSF